MSSETPEKTEDLKAIKKSATATLGVSISLTLIWLFIYNIVSYEMNPLLAFFKILDGINEIVVGMLTVVVIGIGIVVVFTITAATRLHVAVSD